MTESELSEEESDEASSNEECENYPPDKTLENTETECNECTFSVEIPPELKESDQVLINRETGEILIFPKDETQDEESWIQSSIIENISQDQGNKIYYGKSDSQKLEKFLRQEREGTAKIIKERCLEHSKKCDTCEILSRRAESRKESTLIKEIWENVNAEETSDGKFVIKHTYVYRHDVSEVFPPWKSNIIEARKLAKKVIYKARKQGNLSEFKCI